MMKIAGKNDRVPDFVFLAHVVDVVSSMHVPFAFRSCSSLPWATHPVLLPLWPVAFCLMLLQVLCSKTFTVSFYYLRGRLHQTWTIPRYSFQVRVANCRCMRLIDWLALALTFCVCSTSSLH